MDHQFVAITSFHDLRNVGFRRTALTRMHNAGVPTKPIQRIPGHRTLAVLSGYLEVTDEQVEGAIVKLVF
ncbi:conserved hypothetical protein (plasmid) [Acaryochloris marina MBIC11017]|uniref:Tyr recombinase domain-containing protein n=2 Tax=Acaryochloris marina TaxID=155978 RepID=A8ZLP8_ACAM1|nr:conserved hypothetical protein [Acaryochloris marina MBIC11017]